MKILVRVLIVMLVGTSLLQCMQEDDGPVLPVGFFDEDDARKQPITLENKADTAVKEVADDEDEGKVSFSLFDEDDTVPGSIAARNADATRVYEKLLATA